MYYNNYSVSSNVLVA